MNKSLIKTRSAKIYSRNQKRRIKALNTYHKNKREKQIAGWQSIVSILTEVYKVSLEVTKMAAKSKPDNFETGGIVSEINLANRIVSDQVYPITENLSKPESIKIMLNGIKST